MYISIITLKNAAFAKKEELHSIIKTSCSIKEE